MIQTDALTLARQIRTKEISPVAVIDAVLNRIEALQPTVNAFITVTADEARDAARRAEAAVMAGEPLGPLTACRSRSRICCSHGACGPRWARASLLTRCRRKTRSPSAGF